MRTFPKKSPWDLLFEKQIIKENNRQILAKKNFDLQKRCFLTKMQQRNIKNHSEKKKLETIRKQLFKEDHMLRIKSYAQEQIHKERNYRDFYRKLLIDEKFR